jgi:hypothetical protein
MRKTKYEIEFTGMLSGKQKLTMHVCTCVYIYSFICIWVLNKTQENVNSVYLWKEGLKS